MFTNLANPNKNENLIYDCLKETYCKEMLFYKPFVLFSGHVFSYSSERVILTIRKIIIVLNNIYVYFMRFES